MIIAVSLTLALAAMPAAAEPVAGATYRGVAADGAEVTFTVSSDGTIVDSYRIDGVRGDTCTFLAEGDKGSWGGAPIQDNAFQYRLGNAIQFGGTFPGAQSASGTFRLHNDAVGSTPACDTGVVSWTATTTATPPGVGGSGSGGSGSGTSGGTGGAGGTSGTAGKRVFASRVTLHTLSAKRLGGWIRSSSRACRARRTVILWRGSRQLIKTKSKADGTYWFPRSKMVRGRRVRASVLARSFDSGICAAGSSTFIIA